MAAEEGQVIVISSVDAWKEQLENSKTTNKLIVVDFTATWCGPCRFMAPVFAELAKNTPEVVFLKVDVDELKTVTEECGVEAMPTFILFKDGKEVDKVVGANKDDLQLKISRHATAVV